MCRCSVLMFLLQGIEAFWLDGLSIKLLIDIVLIFLSCTYVLMLFFLPTLRPRIILIKCTDVIQLEMV